MGDFWGIPSLGLDHTRDSSRLWERDLIAWLSGDCFSFRWIALPADIGSCCYQKTDISCFETHNKNEDNTLKELNEKATWAEPPLLKD
jgi:hypothetical protein